MTLKNKYQVLKKRLKVKTLKSYFLNKCLKLFRKYVKFKSNKINLKETQRIQK